MKMRSASICLALLAVLVVSLYFFTGPITDTDEARSVENVVSDSKPDLSTKDRPEVGGESRLEKTLLGGTDRVENATIGGPIPFAVASMEELEEVVSKSSDAIHTHRIREWRGRLSPTLIEIEDLLETGGEKGVLAFALPDASQIELTKLRFQSFGPNQGVITGKVLGDEFGEAVLSYVNQAVAGSIRDVRNNKVWEIRNAGDGRQYIAQVDVNALGKCAVCNASVTDK